MKSRWLRTAAIPLFVSGPAVAADMAVKAPAPPPAVEIPKWTGFYLGAYAGGAWGRSSANTSVDCSTGAPDIMCATTVPTSAVNAAAVDAAGAGTVTASGFTGGVQAGFDMQADRFVYGLETDFGAMHLRGSRQGSGIYPVAFNHNFGDSFTVGSSFSTDWLFTLRGRAGWTVTPNVLAYATGGLAVTRLGVSSSFSDISTIVIPPALGSEYTSAAAVKAGFAVGAGIEWMLDRRWSVKAEYLFMDFGKVTTSGLITNPGLGTVGGVGYSQGISTSSDLTANIARAGVNYKF